MRGGGITERVPPWLIVAVVLAAATWSGAGTVVGSSHTAITYPTGSAHIELTDLESGAQHSYDLPVYPPPSGLRGDLLQVSEVRDAFGSRPPGTEWFENIGRMQVWFADLSAATSEPSGAAPFLSITGPAQLGESQAGQFSDVRVMVRRPGQPYGAENTSAAGGTCMVDVRGDPKVELTGRVTCRKLTSIFMNGLIEQPPDIDLEATFTIQTGSPAPTAESREIDVAFDHIEVVQVVQDAGNTVPLVAGKPAVARVFVRVNGPGPVENVVIQVSLKGLRNGVELAPPLAPITIAGVVRPAVNRSIKTESANFVLPMAWLQAGTLGLEASIAVAGPDQDSQAENNDGIDAVDLQVRRPLLVAHVPVCFAYDDIQRTYSKCPGNSNTKGDVIGQLYPAPRFGVVWYEIPNMQWYWSHSIANPFGYALLLRDVESRWEMARAASVRQLNWLPDQLVAMVPDEVDPMFGGLASWSGGTDTAVVTEYRSDGTNWTIAHEIGHNLGLSHTATGDPACRASHDGGLGDWPRDDDSIGELGWDVVTNDIVHAQRKDLMSYCRVDELWISPFHYRKLFDSRWGDARVSGFSGAIASRAAAAAAAAPGPGDYVFLRGTVRRDGSGGSLLPAFTLTTDAAPRTLLTTTSGTTCLGFDSASAPPRRWCFEPTFTAGEGDGQLLDEAPFNVAVPAIAGLARISLEVDGLRVASLASGSAAPAIRSDARPGETWSEPETLTWTATAASETTILYSPDGGELWLPYSLELPAESIEVDPSRLIAGSGNLFRILVSDGVVTAATDVGPITVPESIGRAPLPARDELPEPGPSTTEPPARATTPPGSPSIPGSSPTGDGLPLPLLALGGGLLALLVAVGLYAAWSRPRRVIASVGPPPTPTAAAPPSSPWLQPAPVIPPVTSARPDRTGMLIVAILGVIAIMGFGALGFAAASVGPDAIGPDPGLTLAISIAGVLGGFVAVAVAITSQRRQP